MYVRRACAAMPLCSGSTMSHMLEEIREAMPTCACLVPVDDGLKDGTAVLVGNNAPGLLFVVVHDGLTLGDDVVDGESEFGKNRRPGSTRPKRVHRNLSVREAVPSMIDARLNRQSGDVSRQDLGAVRFGLFQEHFLARHGHDAHCQTVLGMEFRGGFHTQSDFRSSGDQNKVGRRPFRFGDNDVSTVGCLFDGGVGEGGDGTAGTTNDSGGRRVRESDLVRGRCFVQIGGTEHIQIGQASQRFEGFNRLVGRSIFAQSNGIVRKDKDNTKTAESGKADPTEAISGKDEKGRTIRTQSAVRENAIANCDHTVFADPEPDVPSNGRIGLKVLHTGVIGKIGRC